ncbi:hypothetical protein Bpfe_013681, partial [Biomphalaria pfeifferi]
DRITNITEARAVLSVQNHQLEKTQTLLRPELIEVYLQSVLSSQNRASHNVRPLQASSKIALRACSVM